MNENNDGLIADCGSLARALSDTARWLNSLADDGPDLRINAHRKAAHEAAELADDPSLYEFADVLICLIGTALHHDWTLEEIADAVALKTRINARRTWAQEPDGTWQHVDAEKVARDLDPPKMTSRVAGDDEPVCGVTRPGTLGYQRCLLVKDHGSEHRSQDGQTYVTPPVTGHDS